MDKKIFVTRKILGSGLQMLKDKGYTVDVYPKDGMMPQKKLIRALKSKPYDAVLCLLTDKIDSAVFNAAPSVKMYANYAVGFDNIDVAEAKKRGIIAANTPAPLMTESVAEHAVALMLALAKRLVEADAFTKAGKYDGWDPMGFIGTDVSGKTLGLLGAGRIGARVAQYCKSLGMNILYYDVAKNENIEKEASAEFRSTVDDVLRQADFVSIHVPLLDSTKHLINADRLKMMKPTAYLVNTSRGPVVDEKALEEALRAKTIAGAGLDVFEFEPKISKGLRKLGNVILTPHIASASAEARSEMSEMVANNIIDFFEGRTPKNSLMQ